MDRRPPDGPDRPDPADADRPTRMYRHLAVMSKARAVIDTRSAAAKTRRWWGRGSCG